MARLPVAIILIAALALAACGVKGGLESPPAAPPKQNDPFILDPLI